MTKAKASELHISESAQAMLAETLDWAGRFIAAYGKMKEAQLNEDEEAFTQAWGDLTTALFVLQDKAKQSHRRLEEG